MSTQRIYALPVETTELHRLRLRDPTARRSRVA